MYSFRCIKGINRLTIKHCTFCVESMKYEKNIRLKRHVAYLFFFLFSTLYVYTYLKHIQIVTNQGDNLNSQDTGLLFELPHWKTNNLYANTKAQISFAVTAKLISAFVFATRIVQFLNFINPKFPVSIYLL